DEWEPLNVTGIGGIRVQKKATMAGAAIVAKAGASAPADDMDLLFSDPRLLQRVIRRHAEQRTIRFGADDVLQAIDVLPCARIAVLREHEELQVRREPLLRHNPDRLQISDRARGDRPRRPASGCG